MKSVLPFLGAGLFLSLTALHAAPVINEIQFHAAHPAAAENPALEFVELHNPDAVPADISGWSLSGSVGIVFPAGTVIPAGGYLVVCANNAAFHAAYPSVTNYLGGWAGELSNIDDTVELRDATLAKVDKVHYDTEGDWARRRQGGVDPANAAYQLGWIWLAEADGGGKTLERRSPARPGNEGQNWSPSTTAGGTPGSANSVLTANLPPLVTNVSHTPAVPTASQLVTISAKVTDESSVGLVVSAHWRLASLTPGAFTSITMLDNGLGTDEVPGDGVYTVNLPAQAVGSIVEYYVQATDAAAQTRTWPAPSDDTGGHNTNALYQVDEEAYTGIAPLYRVIMPPLELDGFDHEAFSSANRSTQNFHATFVALNSGDTHVRQQASVRIRGAGSRGSHPRSFRVDLLNSEPWQDNVSLNLNSQYSYLQVIGARLAQSAGVVTADARAAAVRFNGTNRAAQTYVDPVNGNAPSNWTRHYGLYAHVEPIGRDYLKRHFPGDSSGNLYTKRGTDNVNYWNVAGNGANLATYYTGQNWEKQNNSSAQDWSDLHGFVSTMTANASNPTAAYLTNTGAVMSRSQWLKTIGFSALMNNGETNLTNGRDDDYSVYRGADGKFKLLLHDLDTIMGLGDADAITDTANTVFDVIEPGQRGDTFAKLIPLFDQPGVVKEYYGNLAAMLEGPLSKTRFDALMADTLAHGGWGATETAAIKTTLTSFMDARRLSVLGNAAVLPTPVDGKIVKNLTATSGASVTSGYEKPAGATTAITGVFDSTHAASVLVNGQATTLDPKTGTFSTVVTSSTALVAQNATWKYKDDGSDQGTTWKNSAFNDTAWASGPAQLGYGGDGETTVIAGGVNTHMTDYFRHTFTLANPAAYSSYTLRYQRDDGVVIYLNGAELTRENMPAGTVLSTTAASGTIADETLWVSLTIPAASFAAGTNVLAAEVHQVAGSGDSRWRAELLGTSVTGGTAVTLNPGLNKVTVEEKDASGNHLRYKYLDLWRDTGATTAKGGAIAASETWPAAGGPYLVSTALTIGNGVTLTIAPGATVYFANGIGITLSGTGRIVAEGTEFNRIRLGRAPGGTALGGKITLGSTSTETRFVWCDFEYFGGAAVIESTTAAGFPSPLLVSHCTMTKTDVEYISTHGASFIVEDSYFETYSKPAGYPPANGTALSRPEMLHGTAGLPAGGYGIYRRNVFGHTYGFNDIIDFTGGQRPGPIMQFLDNVFVAATDDHLDLDSTDAFIAGNVFLHCHQDPARTRIIDTGSCISGGVDVAGEISEWTVFGNLFYDNDHLILAKGKDDSANANASRYSFLHNTVYHISGISTYGSVGVDIAAFNYTDDGAQLPPASGGSGGIIQNNIIWDATALTANYDGAKLSVTMSNNLLPMAWAGPGTGNTVADPLLQYDRFSGLAYDRVEFESDYPLLMARAKAAFTLSPGSPAKGAATDGLDLGGMVSYGAILTGVPAGTTSLATATVSVGPTGVFNPAGATIPAYNYGYPSYQWKLDGGSYSAETASTLPITLSGLSAGTHTLQVLGKTDGGIWQIVPTVAVWTVDPAYAAPVQISEVLATNTAAYANGVSHPDVLELNNPGTAAVDISGWAVSDDATQPAKYVFGPGTILAPGQFLVLLADTYAGTAGLHLGFSLDGDGESVVLSQPNAGGWLTVDSVTFGSQIPNLSIARVGADRHWDLATPTLGSANLRQPTATASGVRLNEWIASSDISFRDDMVELYNPSSLPANLSGAYLSNSADVPLLHQLPPLTFLAAQGFGVYQADGNVQPQANHLGFKLSAFYDWVVLSDAAGTLLDRVPVTGAAADIAEGRLPDGSDTIQGLDFPSPGFTNVSGIPGTNTTVTTTLTDWGSTWKFDDTQVNTATAEPAGWNTALGFVDTAWKTGPGPIGFETWTTVPPNPGTGVTPFYGTQLTGYASSRLTYLFRRSFTFSGTPANVTLKLSRWIDDGYVVYLNGVELDRKNMAGTPPFLLNTQASASVSDATAENDLSITLPAGALVNGTNLLAVEVHQNGTASSDVTFALKIVATESTTTPPTIDPVRLRMENLTNYLRVTEVMFAPANGSNYEFLELTNTSATATLDLAGVRLTGPGDFLFPASTLAPGAATLVVRDLAAFRSVYGAAPTVVGVFTGKLDNAGEEIALQLPDPWPGYIQRFTYVGGWFANADGLGSSLEITSASAARSAWNSKAVWQASVASGGSPAGLNAVNSLATWNSAYGVSNSLADNDGDGLSNLAEYALGLVPNSNTDGSQGHLSPAFQGNTLGATLSLPASPPADVTCVIEANTVLGPTGWTTLASRTGSGAWTGPTTVFTTSPVNGRVTISFSTPVSAADRKFVRLRFVGP